MGAIDASGRRTGLFGAAAMLTAASVVNLLINLLIQMAVAAFFGLGAEMDAYRAAMAIPQWLQLFLGVALTFVLVPFFVTAFRRDEPAGWRAASAAVNLTLVALLASIGVAVAVGRPLIRAVAPGLPAPGTDLAARLFLVTCPVGVLLLLQAILVTVCHARFRFVRPVAATFLNGVVSLALLWALHGRLGILALPVAFATGTVLAVVVLGSLLVRGRRYRPTLSIRGTGLDRAALVALPLIVTAPIYQSDSLVSTRIASVLGESVLSYLRWALVLLTAMFQATATGLAAAIFPFLSRAADETDRRVLIDRLRTGVSAMLYVALPVAALAVPLAHPGIRGLFQRGAFKPEHVGPVAALLLLYLPAYVAMCVGTVTSNTIFALKRTFEASVLFVLAFGVFVVGLVVLVPRYSFYGIALAVSLHFVTRLALSWGLLRRRLGALGGRTLLGSAWRFVVCAGAAGAVAWGVNAALAPLTRLVLLPAMAAGAVGAAVYLVLTLFVLRTPLGDLLRTRLAALRGRRRE